MANVELIACKVMNARGWAREGAVLASVRWAIGHEADVINYSGSYAPLLKDGSAEMPPQWVWAKELLEEEAEFARAMEVGAVSVVSAGNEGE